KNPDETHSPIAARASQCGPRPKPKEVARMTIIHRVFVGLLFSLAACSAASPSASPADVAVDQVEVVRGVPDRGGDPAVVAIDIAERGLCTGALVAPNVVLTARHCVSITSEQVSCPPRGPQITSDRSADSLRIFVGNDLSTAVSRARGAEIVVPQSDVLCEADIALIVLDRAIHD